MTDIVQQRLQALRKTKREVLNLPPKAALDKILTARHPAAIVHAFTEQDFHLLVHDIGVDDARQLLALATNRQIEYMVDTEIWSGDQIIPHSTIRWLDTLYRSDPDRTTHWLMTEKLAFLELFLFRNIQVIIREHDQDSGTLPPSYFTHDDILYIAIPDIPTPEAPNADDENLRKQLIKDLLDRMAATDYPLYRSIVFEAVQVIPAEVVEEEYRLRNVRMAEKGFLPYEEAVGIYQPVTADQLFSQPPKYADRRGDDPGRLPAPVLSAAFMDTGSLFGQALKTIDNPDLVSRLQVEFATLCNQVVVADKQPLREKRQLEVKVKKACSYISLGLEHLTGPEGTADLSRTGELICKYRLSEIFRVGYGLGLQLKWQARKWLQKSWANRSKLPLNFWGETWLGVLGGLLLDHPCFYDNYARGVLYRNFESLADIAQTRNVLTAVAAFDDLLSQMDITLEPLETYGYVGHYGLALSLWTRHLLNISGKIRPLDIKQIRQFFSHLWEPGKKPYHISDQKKTAFLKWLSDASGQQQYDLSRSLGQTFETLFTTLEEEYANVSARSLELKYVQRFFLLAPQSG